MNREEIWSEYVDGALGQIKDHTNLKIAEKGPHTFASIHEISGILTEEYDEMKEAIHSNDYQRIKEELLDIATVCHFGIACIDAKKLDW